MSKAKTIQPLDGGYDKYVDVLERIREYMDRKQSLTKDQLRAWYSKQYGKTRRKEGSSYDDTSKAYVNSLFRCGLLKEPSGGIGCTFSRNADGGQQIIKIIDRNVVFIIEMLSHVRDGVDGVRQEDVCKVARKRHDLNENQVHFRRGWLQSTGMLESENGRLWATKAGKRLLDDEGVTNGEHTLDANPAEFSGGGEGPEHKSLKHFVYKRCEAVLQAWLKEEVSVAGRQEEFKLDSSDRVDVTAWNRRTIWHIEVKSKISSDADLKRGVYQCIKYQAVGEAMEEEGDGRRVNTLLVVEKQPPAGSMKLAKRRGVSVHCLSPRMRRSLDRQRDSNG